MDKDKRFIISQLEKISWAVRNGITPPYTEVILALMDYCKEIRSDD